jgi:Domain of unknown function (DUF397)
MTHDPGTTPRWRTSSYSGSGNNCVQVAADGTGGVAVRDSKHPQGAALKFSARAWRCLVATITKVG